MVFVMRFCAQMSVGIVCATCLMLIMFLPASISAQNPEGAFFQFTVEPHPETFVFKVTDPTKIQEARSIIAAGGRKIVSGTIIKQPVYYNAPWSFYFDPKTISFADFAVEVCDANIRYLENNLLTAYPQWCPWTARLLREVPSPPRPGGNLNPAVSMTFPHADNTFSTTAVANVTISAAADDPDGAIAGVEFFSDGTKIGATTTHPYRFTWTIREVGTYTVLAKATDNLGASTTSRSVTFSVTQPTLNPIDFAHVFVRQHYEDFLNREPDSGGLEYWAGEILRCGSDPLCIHTKRIGVSGAFFVESEFQETGGFVYRLYKVSYGTVPQFDQFMPDRGRVIAGDNPEAGKESFASEWVQRPDFLTKYPASLPAEQFVDSLLLTVQQGSGVNLSARRQIFIEDLLANASRARVVRMIADDDLVRQEEYRRAFVLMQYFGYLRRDPDEGGYLFWLDVLNNQDPDNYRGMICSFLTSAEYQRRFAPLLTRTNADCAQ